MTKLKIPNHQLRKRGTLWAFALLLAAFTSGCSSTPNVTRPTTTAAATPTPEADPFAALDGQGTAGTIDPPIFQERVDAARQEWLRALVAQQKNEKTEVVKHFESAIDILDRLITYPGIDSNKDFQDVSKNVIDDYKKYIPRI